MTKLYNRRWFTLLVAAIVWVIKCRYGHHFVCLWLDVDIQRSIFVCPSSWLLMILWLFSDTLIIWFCISMFVGVIVRWQWVVRDAHIKCRFVAIDRVYQIIICIMYHHFKNENFKTKLNKLNKEFDNSWHPRPFHRAKFTQLLPRFAHCCKHSLVDNCNISRQCKNFKTCKGDEEAFAVAFFTSYFSRNRLLFR